MIQISPNIPGGDKKIFPAKELHYTGVKEISKIIFREKATLINYRDFKSWPFYISFFVVSVNSYRLKEICTDLEEIHPFGRFWDIDVYQSSGRKVTRNLIKHGERRCFLCADSAKVCSYKMRHSQEELIRFIRSEYYDGMQHLGG